MSGIISDNVGRATGLIKSAGGGGKVLQVVSATSVTVVTTTSTSFAASSLDLDITPAATSSKILLMASFTSRALSHNEHLYTLYRDSTNLGDADDGMMNDAGNSRIRFVHMHYLDSPSSTSSINYEVWMKLQTSGNLSIGDGDNSKTPMQVITAIEIGA